MLAVVLVIAFPSRAARGAGPAAPRSWKLALGSATLVTIGAVLLVAILDGLLDTAEAQKLGPEWDSGQLAPFLVNGMGAQQLLAPARRRSHLPRTRHAPGPAPARRVAHRRGGRLNGDQAGASASSTAWARRREAAASAVGEPIWGSKFRSTNVSVMPPGRQLVQVRPDLVVPASRPGAARFPARTRTTPRHT
jgi:hypothetical protein